MSNILVEYIGFTTHPYLCIGVGSTGAPGAGAPLYFFQLTSILVHLLQALIVSDVQK